MTLELIITLLLFAGLVLSGSAILWIAKTSPTDGQTFQVFAGVFHDLLGSFLTLIVPRVFGMLKPVPNGTPQAPGAGSAALPGVTVTPPAITVTPAPTRAQAQAAQESADKQAAATVKP